jgi:hypothetical protein
MIIRNSNGKIETINKYDFIDDNKYYEKLLKIMKRFKHENKEKYKQENTQNKLLSKL